MSCQCRPCQNSLSLNHKSVRISSSCILFIYHSAEHLYAQIQRVCHEHKPAIHARTCRRVKQTLARAFPAEFPHKRKICTSKHTYAVVPSIHHIDVLVINTHGARIRELAVRGTEHTEFADLFARLFVYYLDSMIAGICDGIQTKKQTR